MFQNPISWPSHNKCRKTIIIQKVLVTQSCNIVHCNWHTQKPICADLQAFVNTFSLCKLIFFSVFCQGEFRKQPKFHILLILTGNNALKLLEWCICRVWGMPNPILQVLQVSVISGSVKKLQYQAKNFTFCWFWLGKCIEMAWVGAYVGFEACQIQCYRFWVSVQ